MREPTPHERRADQPLQLSRLLVLARRVPDRIRGGQPDRAGRRHTPAAVECLIWAVGAAVCAAPLALAVALLPQIDPPEGDGPRTHPQPRRTAHSAPTHPQVENTDLIIMQNVDCWLGGQPGATCGPERTYR